MFKYKLLRTSRGVIFFSFPFPLNSFVVVIAKKVCAEGKQPDKNKNRFRRDTHIIYYTVYRNRAAEPERQSRAQIVVTPSRYYNIHRYIILYVEGILFFGKRR